MLEQLTGTIIHLIQGSGYLGIFFLMVLNACAIPIPSEVTLPFSGFLASQNELSMLLVILIAIFADMVGSIAAYIIGYFLEESLILSLIKKYGKFLLLTEHDYLKVTSWLKKYGSPVVFIGKLTPGVKSFVSLGAGIAEIKFHKFLVSAFLADIIYVSLVTYVGFYLGSQWSTLGVYFRKFEILILIALVLGFVFYVNYKLKLVKLRR